MGGGDYCTNQGVWKYLLKSYTSRVFQKGRTKGQDTQKAPKMNIRNICKRLETKFWGRLDFFFKF